MIFARRPRLAARVRMALALGAGVAALVGG
ncbi:MAG: hypothetical protein K0Q62_561, partial [Phenylobacterium sp.]|nr:hypothetical protein [Phenylobacterium sp.]